MRAISLKHNYAQSEKFPIKNNALNPPCSPHFNVRTAPMRAHILLFKKLIFFLMFLICKNLDR